MTVIQTCERIGSLFGTGLDSGRLGPGCGERHSPGGVDLPERGTRGRGLKSGEVSSASAATSQASKEAVWFNADGGAVFSLSPVIRSLQGSRVKGTGQEVTSPSTAFGRHRAR